MRIRMMIQLHPLPPKPQLFIIKRPPFFNYITYYDSHGKVVTVGRKEEKQFFQKQKKTKEIRSYFVKTDCILKIFQAF